MTSALSTTGRLMREILHYHIIFLIEVENSGHLSVESTNQMGFLLSEFTVMLVCWSTLKV